MPKSTSVQTGRVKLLLVEDSEFMRGFLSRELKAMSGLELVATAGSKQEAMEAFEAQVPDVVILDLGLQESTGLDVLAKIRQRSRDCLVLVFSGYDSEPIRRRCQAAGASRFFSKARETRGLLEHLRAIHENGLPPSSP